MLTQVNVNISVVKKSKISGPRPTKQDSTTTKANKLVPDLNNNTAVQNYPATVDDVQINTIASTVSHSYI